MCPVVDSGINMRQTQPFRFIYKFYSWSNPVLEIRHLKTLHALREADSLVDAADRLHLTQSALSHQFKELEERMGMPLFVR